ncbi:MAG: GIY-YIG nuclease family protein [Ktedonobacteraceae bacterium]
MNTLPHRAKNGKLFTVYALIDPRDQVIRYIGITHDVYQRMRQHSRCIGDNAAKNAWIQELQEMQLMFIMQSIEQVKTLDQALERELYWIKHYLHQGVPLLNISGVQPPATNTQSTGFIRYSTDKFLSKLYFRGIDGELIGFTQATGRQFAEYLDRYVEYDWRLEELDSEFSKWNIGGWRCNVLNHLRQDGIPLEIYNHRGEQVTDLIGNPLKRN